MPDPREMDADPVLGGETPLTVDFDSFKFVVPSLKSHASLGYFQPTPSPSLFHSGSNLHRRLKGLPTSTAPCKSHSQRCFPQLNLFRFNPSWHLLLRSSGLLQAHGGIQVTFLLWLFQSDCFSITQAKRFARHFVPSVHRKKFYLQCLYHSQ